MFTTFAATSPSKGGIITPATTSPNRPKRSQVARACDWCRIHRIKCDNNTPCYNCRSRGGQCSNKGTEVRTLPYAMREIERLRARVKELEEQLRNTRKDSSIDTLPNSVVATESTGTLPKSAIDPLQEHGGKKKGWEGIHTRTAHSPQTQWYGPSSLFYFMGRMSSYLDHSDSQMQPNSASKTFASLTSDQNGNPDQSTAPKDATPTGDLLTGFQEDYFLSLFWQSYGCTLQILDEAEFREHYRSLWTPPRPTRKSSALVDIVLALCMQYGLAFLPSACLALPPKSDVDANDATIAGRWFYHRCQTLLAGELEAPTISTLQCHILSVIYLCNASFQNMAHSALALAVRTAHTLGLHLEPRNDLPRTQRELRKRIWWSLWTVESKTCMKLGRPRAAQLSHTTVNLPADDHELALLSGSNFASFGAEVTWLTYGLLNTQLVLAAQAVYMAFYEQDDENELGNMYASRDVLESRAKHLQANRQTMRAWSETVPDALKTKRKNGGEPFSTDGTELDVEIWAPLWLQRQRVLLECLWHNLCMNLCRPFICFPGSDSPAAKVLANLSLSHALTLTGHLHTLHCPAEPSTSSVSSSHPLQLLTPPPTSTSTFAPSLGAPPVTQQILQGWHEVIQWQWNVSMTLLGFLLAYPNDERREDVKQGITKAIGVLETLGGSCAGARSMGEVVTRLAGLISDIENQHRISPTDREALTSNAATEMNVTINARSNDLANTSTTMTNMTSLGGIVNGTFTAGPIIPQLEDEAAGLMPSSTAMDMGAFTGSGPMDFGSMGMAFSVDSFHSFEPFFDGGFGVAGGMGGMGGIVPGGTGMSDGNSWLFQHDYETYAGRRN